MAKVNPVIFTPFIQEALVTVNNILNMGIVEIDTSSVIRQGGEYFVRPYQENLDAIDNIQRITTTTTLTPSEASDFKETLVSCHIGDSYKEIALDRITRGSAGLDALKLQKAEIILRGLQNYLISTVKGVFATELATSHVYNGSVVGSGIFGIGMATMATQTIFGEQMDDFDAYIMNSVTYQELVTAGAAQFLSASEFSNQILRTGRVPTFLGKRVYLNNTLCAADTTTTPGTTLYPIFITKGNPLYMAWQQDVVAYDDFDPAVGHGTYKTYWYADFVPAVKGVSWTHTTFNPTTTELETGSYWTKVFEDKNIPIIKVLAKPVEV
jgi:hypothetical protein